MTITAFFGDDDVTLADIGLAESGDVAVLTGSNVAAASLALAERGDSASIVCLIQGNATLVLQEAGDNASIGGAVTLSATIAATEARDICVINTIAPTSIITNPDPRFGVRVDQGEFRVIVDRPSFVAEV